MVWSIDFDEDFSIWFEAQDQDLQEEILASLKMLAELGPALRRPRVGNIEGDCPVQGRSMENLHLILSGTQFSW